MVVRPAPSYSRAVPSRKSFRRSPSCGNRSAALGLGILCLERPGSGWLCPLRSGISGGNKFIGQQAISRPNGGRSWVTNPTQSMANVVNHDPRCCCSGHISLRVEIEMRAGNISTDAPCPCHVMPNSHGVSLVLPFDFIQPHCHLAREECLDLPRWRQNRPWMEATSVATVS